MSIKRVTYFIVAAILFSALYASGTNTWKFASDFNGLVLLVSTTDDDRSYNPFSDNFFWISQDTAFFIIKNMEYPYRQCSSFSRQLEACDHPRIDYAARWIAMFELDAETEAKMIDVIKFLIKRGEPVDAYNSEGFTALQSVIFANRPRLVSLILEAGANPYLPVKGESKYQGKNSVEMVEFLSTENVDRFLKLKVSFYEKLPTN